MRVRPRQKETRRPRPESAAGANGYFEDERLANEQDLDPAQDLELAQELEVL
jgi:hypothetical protein